MEASVRRDNLSRQFSRKLDWRWMERGEWDNWRISSVRHLRSHRYRLSNLDLLRYVGHTSPRIGGQMTALAAIIFTAFTGESIQSEEAV